MFHKSNEVDGSIFTVLRYINVLATLAGNTAVPKQQVAANGNALAWRVRECVLRTVGSELLCWTPGHVYRK